MVCKPCEMRRVTGSTEFQYKTWIAAAGDLQWMEFKWIASGNPVLERRKPVRFEESFRRHEQFGVYWIFTDKVEFQHSLQAIAGFQWCILY